MVANHRLFWQPPKVIWKEGLGFITINFSFFNEVTLSYYYSPLLQWFFSRGCETQWKTHDHPSCLPLLALTEIIYTPAYWKYGERGWDRDRGRGKGGGDSVHSCRFAQAFLVTGGWQEMMDLDEDTSLSVRTCLLHFIQLFSQWQTELGAAVSK